MAHPGKEGFCLVSEKGHLPLLLATLPFQGELPWKAQSLSGTKIPEENSLEVSGSHRAFEKVIYMRAFNLGTSILLEKSRAKVNWT